jgi:hypothetical protein
MAAAPGLMSIIMLMGLAGGTSTNDLVSLIDAQDYFQARKIEVKGETMVELAAAEPKDARAQIQQLLAIRWLGEHPELAKKVQNAHDTLRQIAEGEKAQGRLGFAQQYAQRSLAAIDGKPVPEPRAIPNNSLRVDALRWFPKDATMLGGYDFRASGSLRPLDEDHLRKLIAGLVPAREKDQVYGVVEKLGNVRVDRYSFALVVDSQQPESFRMVMRYTGLADHQVLRRLIEDGLKQARQNPRVVPSSDKGNESVTLITTEKEEMALALLGNRDVLVTVGTPGQSARETAEEALAVRTGKRASVLKGPLAERLQKMPAAAVGLFVGEFSDKMRQGMVGRKDVLKVAPVRLSASLVRNQDVIALAELTMANADDAKVLADSVAEWKKQGLAGLDQLPPQIKPGPGALGPLKKALEGVRVETTEAHLKVRAEVSPAALDTARGLAEKAMQWFLMAMPARPAPASGPPLPVEKEKAGGS